MGDAALVAEDVVEEGAPPGTRTTVTEVGHDMLEDSVEVCNEVPTAEPAGGLNLNISATGRGTDDERRGGGVGDGRETGVVEQLVVDFSRIGDVALLFAASYHTTPDNG